MATRPEDIIPAGPDPMGKGARMLDLVGRFPLTQGREAGRLLGEVLMPWQRALIARVWGDTLPDGSRRIQEVGCKLGKGSGKSTLAAAVAVATIVTWELDQENTGNQIVLVAANLASADLIFRHMREGIAADAWLRKRFHTNLSRRQVTYKPTGVTVHVISPDLQNAIGLRPGLTVADELHQAALTSPDFSAVIDQLKRGSMNTESPLLLGLTTAAVARPEGYYREWIARMRAIRDGTTVNDRVLPVLFEFPPPEVRPDLDVGMEAEWWRAMPSLRTPDNPLGTMDATALRQELEEAAESAGTLGPGDMERLLSQRFGLEASERGGSSGMTPLARYWDTGRRTHARPQPTVAITVGMDPSAGLSDPFAVVAAWREGDSWCVHSRQFLTAQAESEAPRTQRALYAQAVAAGELTLHATSAELEAAVVAYAATLATHPGGIRFCGDAAGLAGFRARFEGTVGAYEPVSQGWQLIQALELAGGLAHGGQLIHTGQPLLSANVANLTLENGRMRKYDAGQNGVGAAKIDGTMAMLSALLVGSQARDFDIGCLVG